MHALIDILAGMFLPPDQNLSNDRSERMEYLHNVLIPEDSLLLKSHYSTNLYTLKHFVIFPLGVCEVCDGSGLRNESPHCRGNYL